MTSACLEQGSTGPNSHPTARPVHHGHRLAFAVVVAALVAANVVAGDRLTRR